eukprot:Filipodium_phascolosomae@DN2225_c0_g1_i4.p1
MSVSMSVSMTPRPMACHAGEALRLALTVAGLEFLDTRVGKEDWDTKKFEYPLEQLPAIVIDGKMYTQSLAILKWIGMQNKCGLYPEDANLALEVDQALGVVNDALKPFRHSLPEPAFSESRKEFQQGLEKAGAFFEKRISVHKGKYLCGDSMTIGDLATLHVISWVSAGIDKVDKDLFLKYPKVMAAKNLTLEHPAIKKYYQEHPWKY